MSTNVGSREGVLGHTRGIAQVISKVGLPLNRRPGGKGQLHPIEQGAASGDSTVEQGRLKHPGTSYGHHKLRQLDITIKVVRNA